MSSKPDSWLPLYVADYLADTTRFSTEQHGAYLLVIMDYWRNGPPPDDDRTLAQITGLTLARWKAHRPVIASKFQVSGSVWHHKRIDAEIAKAQRKSELARDAAYRRHGKTDALGDPPDDADASADAGANAHAGADAGQDAEGMQKGCSSPSPTQEVLPEVLPSPPPAPKSVARTARAPAKTRLPDDFSISERVRQWAAEKAFDRLDEHLENFIGKSRAKGYTYADWDEGFMGAIREDWAGLRKGNGAGRQAAIDEAERRIFGGAQERDITDEASRL